MQDPVNDTAHDTAHDKDAVAEALSRLLTSVVDLPPALDDPGMRSGSLWSLGLTSAGFVQLLTAVEDGFGLEWDLDDSVDAVSSFDNLVAHVAAHATRLPGTPSAAAAGSR